MGLRLRFSLAARGGSVRAEAETLVELLSWMRGCSLVEESPGRCDIVWTDGSTSQAPGAYLPLDDIVSRLQQAQQRNPRSISISGLRTGEGFPNLFRDYASGEESLAAWLTLQMTCGTSPVSRGFRLEFSDVDFLADNPRMPSSSFLQQLQSLVDARLVPSCYTMEATEEAV